MGAEVVGARGTIVGRHLVTDAARRAGEAPSAPHPAQALALRHEQLGLMFFPDPVDGVREARRVLRRRAWVA